jgi:hypothetical protein
MAAWAIAYELDGGMVGRMVCGRLSAKVVVDESTGYEGSKEEGGGVVVVDEGV